MFLAGAACAVWDYFSSAGEIEEGISRNAYGEGKRTEDLKVQVGNNPEKKDIQIEVDEQAYTSDEIRKLFARTIKKMDTWILGENKSPDRVEKDLNLLTEIPGQPIDVSWELDRYDVMNVYGELNRDRLTRKGTQVTLQAVLTYRERKNDQALYECTVMVYKETLSEGEAEVEQIKQETRKKNKETVTQDRLLLPRTLNGKELHFYKAMDRKGIVLMVMSVLVVFLLYALEKQNQGKELEKKRRQMRLDYPEIVSKLILLLGAGMTVKRAWRKITEDYRKGEKKEKRYAYEEMCTTLYEMEGGIMESESYERFGRRCNIQEYLRLGALLSQNLRKGTKGLNDMLRLEAVQAFEERKAAAKRLGEEAGTKLLLPMFLMLAVVLVIVIVPAFFSMY